MYYHYSIISLSLYLLLSSYCYQQRDYCRILIIIIINIIIILLARAKINPQETGQTLRQNKKICNQSREEGAPIHQAQVG